MKIAFVYPWFEKFLTNNPELDSGLVDYFLGDFTTPPSLGIPILAGMTPNDVEYELLDDNSGDVIDYTVPYDLVSINCFTPQATRAFEIADKFREQGTTVIMGGFFPSFEPDECLEHCDAVCMGEGEPIWLQVLEDVKNGTLKKKYKGGHRTKPEDLPMPDREIFYTKDNYTWKEDLIQISRGCTYKCAMCAIPDHMGHKMRLRPIEDIVAEIKTLKYENVYIADDSMFFPQQKVQEWSKQLLKALAPLGKKYFVSSSVALECSDEMIDLMVKAGVKNFYCTMNVDPISVAALKGDKEAEDHIIDLVHRLESNGIRFFGSCAIGRDWDDNTIADRVLNLYQKANIKTSEFFIWTPYPGSNHYTRMKKQGRIFDTTWRNYNGAHVVFEPELMSADELYNQFLKIWNNYYMTIKDESVTNLEPSTWENGEEVVGIPLQEKGVRGESVITGIGVMSPIGRTKETVTESLKTGKSGIGEISRFDGSLFNLNHVGEVKDFDPTEELSTEEREALSDRYLQMSLVTAREALKDAGIEIDPANPRGDIAVILATCNGGLNSGEEEYRWKHGKSDNPFNEQTNLQAQYYGYGKALAGALNITGESWVITTACSSTTAAIGLAKTLIDQGYYKTVLVGGADALAFSNVAGFDGLKATSDQKTAPFSLPIGLNIGEAAAFWVVEEMEQSILKGKHCYGRIAGHATTSDAYHPTTPDPRGDGASRTIEKALENAGMSIDQMGNINAHGTGTNANDKSEIKGISRILGDAKVPMVSTKSFFGHCMGATGILEATCNLLAMNENFVPPTLNFTEPRIETDIDFVPNEPKFIEYDAFVSSNYAFGGNNAAVVITKWDREIEKRETQKNRVVITGTSVVSSIGLGMEKHLEALENGDVGVRDASYLHIEGTKSTRAGVVEDFTNRDVNRRLDFKGKNKISMMATAATFWAYEQAGIKPNRRNADDLGLALGVCNGPSEMDYMDGVWSGDSHDVDVSCFSNLTTNSVAGWVSNLLTLKGENITLAPGPHGGMQALAYSFDAVSQGFAQAMAGGGADEIDPQTLYNYDLMGFTIPDEDIDSYSYRPELKKEKLLSEGAAMLVLETPENAEERGATVLGEITGYGMTMDAVPFLSDGEDPKELARAAEIALNRSDISADSVDAVVWAPQGNYQDKKILDALNLVLGEEKENQVPLISTSYNTGFAEATSAVTALASLLETLNQGKQVWKQKSGDESLDNREIPEKIETILVVAGSDVGYNYAMIIKR